MNLADLKAFVAVAETGSINRAALRLGLTQPAATRRVQNFEAAIGAALLDRSSKPPALTAAGRQVLEHCRRVLKAVTELEANAAEQGEPAGELRIGLSPGLAEVVLTSPLDDLRRRFPDLQLRIASQWTASLIEEVRGGGLDCAVALVTDHQTIPAQIIASAIGTEQLVVVSGRNGTLAHRRRRVRVCDLADAGWVLNPIGCGYRAALQRAFDRGNETLRVSAEILGYDLQLSLIARGAGLGLVPRRRFESSPHRRRLRVVKIADLALAATTTMLRSPSLGILTVAVDHLQAQIVRKLRHK